MTLTSKALFIGEFIGLTAIFVVMSPVVALAILSAGYHSAKDDIEERRKWHAEQLRKGRSSTELDCPCRPIGRSR